MGIKSIFSLITSMMNSSSSIFSNVNIASFFAAFVPKMTNVFDKIITFLSNLVYLVAKWIMLIVDILFSYVQELSGLNMDFSSLDALLSGDSDMVFRLLYSSKDVVIPILRSLIALAIFFIIFFSIVALIKNQWTSFKDGKPADIAGVFRTALKSFAFLILLPLMSIVGIIASNLILQTLYNATNVSGASTLGTHIFSASSTSANAFRIYAQNGKRIPIICDFTEDDQVLKYYQDHPMTSEFADYITSSKSAIYATYLIFNNENFITYDSMNNILFSTDENINNQNNAYYQIYDVFRKNELGTETVNYIQNYAEEYYVMADVVDYAMTTSNVIYYKTIEDVLNSIRDLKINDETYKNNLLWNVINIFQLKFFAEDGSEIEISENNYDDALKIYNANGYAPWATIKYTSNYYANDSGGEPTLPMQIQYEHKKGAFDEKDGARFLIAESRTIKFAGVTYSYFYPLTNGVSQNGIAKFSSENISQGQIIAAKGIFQDAKYPTAIKKSNKDSEDIVFYRSNIQTVAAGQSGDLFGFQFEEEQKNANVFSKIINFFKSLFNPESLVPKVDLDTEAIKQAYSSKEETINTLENGRLHIGYMMESDGLLANFLTTKMTGSIYGLNINNLFKLNKLNFLILIGGAFILVKVTFTAVFGLIERAYDLFLIIIFYPTACATIPISNGGYKKWMSTYLSRLFSTYGLILGINFVFILFPVIQNIEFFTPQDVGTSIIIRRVGTLFFGFMNINAITKMINFVVCILFELVALTLIQSVPQVINSIATPKGTNDITNNSVFKDLTQNLKKTIDTVSMVNPVNLGKKVVTHAIKGAKVAAHPMKAGMDFLGKHAPGSAVINAAQNKAFLMKKKKEQNDARDDLMNKMDRSSTEKEGQTKQQEVEEALKKYQDSQKAYTDALSADKGGKLTEQRKAAHDAEKKDKEQNLKSSRDDGEGDAGDDVDFSSMSKKEIKKEKQRIKKAIKSIKRDARASKGIAFWKKNEDVLSGEQLEALERNKSILENARLGLKDAKKEKNDRKAAEKQVKDLEEKLNKYGFLTDEEQEKLDSAKQTMAAPTRKERIVERKADEKNQRKMKKQQEKQDKIAHEDYLIFTGKSEKAKLERIKEVKDDMQDIESKLALTGFTGDLKTITDANLSKLSLDESISEEQRELLAQYSQHRKRIKQFQAYEDTENNAIQVKKDEEASSKISQLASKKNGSKSMRKKLTRLDEDKQILEEINTKLAEYESDESYSYDMKKYRKLKSEQEKLSRKINNVESYGNMRKQYEETGSTGVATRSRKEQKEYDELVREAMHLLELDKQKNEKINIYDANLINKKIEQIKQNREMFGKGKKK